MNFYFELYLKSNIAPQDKWQQFFTTLTAHIGYMNKCKIIVTIDDSIVRYFVVADRDLGVLSNNIDIGVLRPVSEREAIIPETKSSERFVNLTSGGNVLDLREKIALKRGKELSVAEITTRRINAEKTYSKIRFFFSDPAGNYTVSNKNTLTFPAHLLSVNYDENARYVKKEFPKYINIEKALPVLSPTMGNALLSVNTFPYFANDYYLNLPDYEYDKHSFIVGASGTGKSKFIELFIDRVAKLPNKLNYRILVIDPHASLANNLQNIEHSQMVDFSGEDAPELFGDSAKTDISASTELTTTLMKSLLEDQFNPKVERVLRFSLYVLFVGQTMSLGFLKRFLTEIELRNEILQHVSGNIPPNIEQFFATDFNEIRTTHYTEAILPIISLIDEMQMQPSLVGENETSLARTIENNFLTVFSLNKVTMGEKVVKTAAGILIQQIFLLAQARSFNEKILLIIDEVSIVQNPALAAILAEARKYNLFVFLTQQYLGQIEKQLKDAIYANVYNYYVFRVSEEDAEGLIGNLNIDIPKEVIEGEHKKGIEESVLKKRFMTELNARECLVRVSANGQIVPAFKAKTLDVGDATGTAKVDASQLEVASVVKAPMVKKFIEGSSANKTLSSIPSRQDAPPVHETGSTLTTNSQATSELDGIVQDIMGAAKNTEVPKIDKPTNGTQAVNPEKEMSFVNNMEIDPMERRQRKQEKAAELGSSSVASIVNLAQVEYVAAIQPSRKAMLVPAEPSKISDTDSGFGSGNLASVLASQSTNDQLKRNN